MMNLEDGTNVLEPGDEVPGTGYVEANHCGLPWLAGTKNGANGSFMGVITVVANGSTVSCVHINTLRARISWLLV
jgi:hypothetical protein